jgi:hypothetical protein
VIIVSVDGLEVGTYNYSIIVYDGSGHSTSDHVIVSVIPASVTTTTKTTTLVTTTTTSTTETTTTSSATQATTMTTLPNHILAVLIMASILVGVTLFLGIWYRKRK